MPYGLLYYSFIISRLTMPTDIEMLVLKKSIHLAGHSFLSDLVY